MSLRNKIGMALVLLSLGLLWPGLLFPMFHLEVHGSAKAQFANIEGDIINSTRSVMGGIQDLWERDRFLVAALIFLFSALVPLLKGTLVLVSLFSKPERASKIYGFVSSISKWSMADVFVVAVLLTYLSTAGSVQKVVHNISFFGMSVPVELGFSMDSKLFEGFYYFLAYCLVSMIALHFIRFPNKDVPSTEVP